MARLEQAQYKFEESIMLEMASLVLELEDVPYSEVFSKIIGYVDENRASFRMIFSPNGTNKMRFRLGTLLEGLLRQLYLEENEGATDRNVDYMIYYRAQGMILVIQKWVLDDFKESADIITKIMTVLDGRTESDFGTWKKEQQKIVRNAKQIKTASGSSSPEAVSFVRPGLYGVHSLWEEDRAGHSAVFDSKIT